MILTGAAYISGGSLAPAAWMGWNALKRRIETCTLDSSEYIEAIEAAIKALDLARDNMNAAYYGRTYHDYSGDITLSGFSYDPSLEFSRRTSVTVDNYTSWVSMGSALSSYTVSGLTNDVLHTFEVQAVNSVGSSGPSSSSSATPTASTTTPAPAPTPTPPASVPVWNDIPDPYNLTVGDSFYLDLSSYVSGSPTITRNGGVTLRVYHLAVAS